MAAATPTTGSPATGAPITAETVAYIDIGTNSARLMVVRFAPDHSWTVLSMQKETVRLGEGEFGEVRQLQPRGHGARGDGVRAVRRPRARARRRPLRDRRDCGDARGAQRAGVRPPHARDGRAGGARGLRQGGGPAHLPRPPQPRARRGPRAGHRHRRRQHRGRRGRRRRRRHRRVDLARRDPPGDRGSAAGRRRPVRRRRLRGAQALRAPHVAAHPARRGPARGRRLRHLGHHREPRRRGGARCSTTGCRHGTSRSRARTCARWRSASAR